MHSMTSKVKDEAVRKRIKKKQLHGYELQSNMFGIIWPEQVSFAMDPHESFFLRDGEELYFSKWYEEGNGSDEMVSERSTKVNFFKFYMSWR